MDAFAQAGAPAIQGPEALSDEPVYTQFASRKHTTRSVVIGRLATKGTPTAGGYIIALRTHTHTRARARAHRKRDYDNAGGA